MLKGHGADIHQYQNIIADFSSNVSYVDYSDVLRGIINRNIVYLKNYPDVEYTNLRELLALKHDCRKENLIITNGAVSAIYQTAQAFADSETHLFFPEFAEYESACRMFNHKISFSRIGRFTEIAKQTRFVILANPNNPVGTLYDQKELRDLIKLYPDTIFIIDESYMEFVNKSQSMIHYIKDFTNLIIIKSFTKRYTVPGLRLGYIISNPAMIKKLNIFSQPWSVNILAAKVGEEILQNPENFDFDINLLNNEKKRVYDKLSKIPKLEIKHSESNYFLIKLKNRTSQELKDYFAGKHHILIRNAGNFRGLNENFIRISIREKQDNDLLINAFYAFYKN
jgi:threonine-phosphate decarboxylase